MEPCPKCGTEYQRVSDPDVGIARSICECELAHPCFRCKRGHHQPINQARLDNDDEVRHYACAQHGLMDAEAFPVPTAPIAVREARVTPRPGKAAKAVVAVTPVVKPARALKPAPPPRHDLLTVEGMRAELVGRTDIVVCSHCLLAAPFHTYLVRIDEWHLPQPVCGRCREGTPNFTGRGPS